MDGNCCQHKCYYCVVCLYLVSYFMFKGVVIVLPFVDCRSHLFLTVSSDYLNFYSISILVTVFAGWVVVLFVLDIVNFVKYVSDDIPEIICIPMYLEWFDLLWQNVITLLVRSVVMFGIKHGLFQYIMNIIGVITGLVLNQGLLKNTTCGQSVSYSRGMVSSISGCVGLVRNSCRLYDWSWAGQILKVC